MRRDGAMLFVKAGKASSLPNPARDPEMRWDAYCHASDPEALAAELLRGFEIADPDGYVPFFGRPRNFTAA